VVGLQEVLNPIRIPQAVPRQNALFGRDPRRGPIIPPVKEKRQFGGLADRLAMKTRAGRQPAEILVLAAKLGPVRGIECEATPR
jgi:hypothetical protein